MNKISCIYGHNVVEPEFIDAVSVALACSSKINNRVKCLVKDEVAKLILPTESSDCAPDSVSVTSSSGDVTMSRPPYVNELIKPANLRILKILNVIIA